ncbi:hypothetical protein K443DRAFT_15682 [Laccaria amethystina LaAM-08-1]|uniref:HAT C-terminal dimerisation domain-containing protein n=1 Tax=Laccaria amethystina LaAM-08-1 TaxID=1095629 RepID=A0A0C9WL27_9AGAR|nr:hypothetical protein K443DRAFT_15682 [Laccaria amethystina LaAM-08-1]
MHSRKNKEHSGTYGQTWTSIARNYLPIMASSVSSERAFSSAGITISKRRNRLKPDIVEALQCLKCMYKNDLIFRDVLLSSKVEKELDEVEILDLDFRADEIVDQADNFSWDQLVLDSDDDNIAKELWEIQKQQRGEKKAVKDLGCAPLLPTSGMPVAIAEVTKNFERVVDQDFVAPEAGATASPDLPIVLRKGARKDVPQPAPYRDHTPPLVGSSKVAIQAPQSQPKRVMRSPSNSFGLVREYAGAEFPQHDPEEHLQFEDLCTRISRPSSPLPLVSLRAESSQNFFPYPNRSSFCLGDWYWNDGAQKTQAGFQNLVRIITDPEFVPADVLHNKWDHINAALGGTQADDDDNWVDAADEGWKVSQIKINVPFHAGAAHPGTKIFEGVHLYHRPLVAVMKERISDPHYFRHFHIEPYKLLWQPSTSAGRQESRVHGELYTSWAFLRAHAELLRSPYATHLTSFGNTKLWPVYEDIPRATHSPKGDEAHPRHNVAAQLGG